MSTKVYFILIFYFGLFLCSNAQEQGGNNFSYNDKDSLPFDGAYTDIGNTATCECKIKILSYSGPVYATACYKNIKNICGQKDTADVSRKGLIADFMHHVSDGDTIRTFDFEDSKITLELADGKQISMSRNASILVDKDHCKGVMELRVHYGMVYLDLTHGNKSNPLFIQTINGYVADKGTRFTVEMKKEGNDDVEIVRVFEGSVEFKLNPTNEGYKKNNKDKSAAMKQLQQDYKDGKITAGELAQKSLELSQDVMTQNVPKTVTIEAGYESKIVGYGNPTDPISFDVSDDPGKK